VSCLGVGAQAEVWKATLAGEDDRFFAVKITKAPSEVLDPRVLRECLFGQLLTKRDSAHFVDCLAIGTQTLGSTTHSYMVMELLQGKTYMHHLMDGEESLLNKRLLPLVSMWTQLAEAYEAMYNASGADDPFKLIHSDIHAANIVVRFEEGSEEPSVKIIDYGNSGICCLEGTPEACRASLRPGTTNGQLPPPQTFENCTEEKFLRSAKSQALALATVSAMAFDEQKMVKLLDTMEKSDYKKALEQVALAEEPSGYLGDKVIEELAQTDKASKGVKQRFDEALKMMLGMLLKNDEAQAIKTCVPAALLGKLRELHKQLTIAHQRVML